MKRLASLIAFIAMASIFIGCGDSPNYYTLLPQGMQHVSNGGDLGFIGVPTGPDAWRPVYPLEDDWFCNEFAAIGSDVIGREIVYAERSVDPPVEERYFYLEGTKKEVRTFEALAELEDYCRQLGHETVPELTKRTKFSIRQ